MNKNPATKHFWRLFGPILLYWGIEFVVNLVAETVIMAPLMGEMMSSRLAEGGTFSQEDVLNLMTQTLELVSKYQVQILAISAICTIPVTIHLFRADRKRERTLNIPVNKKASLGKYVQIIVLGIVACIGLNCLSVMTDIAFSSKTYQETSEAFYAASVPLQFLCLGIIIPLAEELMFRGVLYKRYREANKFLSAALYSTLLFSMTHGNMVQFLYTFILGIFLAYVYEKYGSFKAPVVLHIVANLTSLVLTNTGTFAWLSSSAFRMGMATVLCAFVGSVVFVLMQKIDEKPEGIEPPKEDDRITPDMFR